MHLKNMMAWNTLKRRLLPGHTHGHTHGFLSLYLLLGHVASVCDPVVSSGGHLLHLGHHGHHGGGVTGLAHASADGILAGALEHLMESLQL